MSAPLYLLLFKALHQRAQLLHNTAANGRKSGAGCTRNNNRHALGVRQRRRRVWCAAQRPLLRPYLLQPGAGTGPGTGRSGGRYRPSVRCHHRPDDRLPVRQYPLEVGSAPPLAVRLDSPISRFILFSLASAGFYRGQHPAVRLAGGLQCFNAYRAHHVRGASLCHCCRTDLGLRRANPTTDLVPRRLLDVQQRHVSADVCHLAGAH